jgi:Ca-activated chloride channel homolog
MESNPRCTWPAAVLGIGVVLCLVFALSAQDRISENLSATACVRISVVDPLNRFLAGLPRESFRIYEDGTEQPVAGFGFNSQNIPTCFGVVWDVSRSRNGGENSEVARTSIYRLLRSRLSETEYFLINFSESAPIQSIAGNMSATDVQIDKSQKRIALFDAIDIGLDQIRQSRRNNWTIIIISDGGETYSKHTAAEIRKKAQESDVQIDGIMIPGPFTDTIRDIAVATGGCLFLPNNFKESGNYIDLLLTESRSRYLLCYAPTNTNHDGTWRKIEVKLNPPPGLPRLTVQARKKRYVPKD